MIASFDKDGNVKPQRFRLVAENEEYQVFKIDTILSKQEEIINREKKIIYECQSKIDNVLKRYVIKYHIGSSTWTLFKW